MDNRSFWRTYHVFITGLFPSFIYLLALYAEENIYPKVFCIQLVSVNQVLGIAEIRLKVKANYEISQWLKGQVKFQSGYIKPVEKLSLSQGPKVFCRFFLKY